MLIVLLWTILIFAESPGVPSATVTAAVAAAAANKSNTDAKSTSGAFIDANDTAVSLVRRAVPLSTFEWNDTFNN